ncbi:MAG: type II toxin-antitoxin system HicA family toxin [Anaerolineae bacterium]|nr:type II toxin-antitoxin system HicA family toxin [Anaerolineae bacterium]
MTKREKRLQKLRQNPKNVSFQDLKTVLEDFGFELVRSSGSHHSFSIMIGQEQHLLVIPYSRPIKTIYVRETLDLIDKLLELETKEDNGDAE